jgi:cobalamin biosynthetic protein CobC
LVVDEAFADLDPALSTAHAADRPGLLVLRSFGKFFGLAGLRLGFAAGVPEFIRPVAERLGPWAVSSLAAEIGRRALNDDRWIADTRERLAEARRRLDEILAGAGLGVIGGTDLFRLIEDDRAPALYAHLAGAGILVRPFPDHAAWLRFGLPGDEGNCGRLQTALDGFQKARQSMM